MAKRRSERSSSDEALDLANKEKTQSIDSYYKKSGPLMAATDLDSEIPILPRTLRSGYGDLRFASEESTSDDPKISTDEKKKARDFFKEIGVDLST